jgi:hypothetical protein
MLKIFTCLFLGFFAIANANVVSVNGDSAGITYTVDQFGSKKPHKSKKKKDLSASEIRRLSHQQMEPHSWEIGIDTRPQL